MFLRKNRGEKDISEGPTGSGEGYKLLVGSLVIVLGFIISIFIAYRMASLMGIGLMGVGILLSVLIGGNILSRRQDLSTDEVRRAISISAISVFFGLLGMGKLAGTEESFLKPILDNFWWIIITIVVFYFGGRTLEKIKGEKG